MFGDLAIATSGVAEQVKKLERELSNARKDALKDLLSLCSISTAPGDHVVLTMTHQTYEEQFDMGVDEKESDTV